MRTSFEGLKLQSSVTVSAVARETRADLPPALPPETRPVGQLIAETFRFYGDHFWPSIVLGVPPAVVDGILFPELSTSNRIAATFTLLPVLLGAAYVRAVWLVTAPHAPDRRRLAWAFIAALVLFIPFPLLANIYLIPAAIWLALFSLGVPAALVEGTGPWASLKRSLTLSLADFVHALGSAAAFFLLVFFGQIGARIALHVGGDISARSAVVVADLAFVPVLFLGLAMLYFDQAARVDSGTPTRRSRHADVHPALEADRSGRADAEVEPGTATRGES